MMARRYKIWRGVTGNTAEPLGGTPELERGDKPIEVMPIPDLLCAGIVEELARSLRPTAFEKATGLGHQHFAEEDAEDREAARAEAHRHLTAIVESTGGGRG